jgi:transposase
VHQAPSLYGLSRSRWRLADLRDTLSWLRSYSLAGISRALRRLGLSRQRGRVAVHSPDPAYQKKLALVRQAVALAREPDSNVTVLYGDEFSFYRQPTLAQSYAPRGCSPIARLRAGANTRYRVCGALDIADGRLTWLAHNKIGVINLKRFLVKLRRTYPGKRVILVWDNWPPHLHPEVLATAAMLGIELLWLPTYAPWTNPIEKLWRWCRQDVLHHHRLAEHWPELRQWVRDWLEQFTRPSPELLRYVGLLPN